MKLNVIEVIALNHAFVVDVARGGRNLTVTGRGFNSIQAPKIIAHCSNDNLHAVEEVFHFKFILL